MRRAWLAIVITLGALCPAARVWGTPESAQLVWVTGSTALQFVGPEGSHTVENRATVYAPESFAACYLTVVCAAPLPSGTSVTYTLRKNGAPTTQSCTLASDGTTRFCRNASPAACAEIAAGDFINMQHVVNTGSHTQRCFVSVGLFAPGTSTTERKPIVTMGSIALSSPADNSFCVPGAGTGDCLVSALNQAMLLPNAGSFSAMSVAHHTGFDNTGHNKTYTLVKRTTNTDTDLVLSFTKSSSVCDGGQETCSAVDTSCTSSDCSFAAGDVYQVRYNISGPSDSSKMKKLALVMSGIGQPVVMRAATWNAAEVRYLAQGVLQFESDPALAMNVMSRDMRAKNFHGRLTNALSVDLTCTICAADSFTTPVCTGPKPTFTITAGNLTGSDTTNVVDVFAGSTLNVQCTNPQSITEQIMLAYELEPVALDAATPSPTLSTTPSPTLSLTMTPTRTPTMTPTSELAGIEEPFENTNTPTVTPTSTPVATASHTVTLTPTRTPTGTVVPTLTPTRTETPVPTATSVPTATLANTPTPGGGTPTPTSSTGCAHLTLNKIPVRDSAFLGTTQNFLCEEDVERYALQFWPFVVSGGELSASGGVLEISPMRAFVDGGYVEEDQDVNLSAHAGSRCWVVAGKYKMGDVWPFTRVPGTHWLKNCGLSKPPLARELMWLAEVDVGGDGNITAIKKLHGYSPVLRTVETYGELAGLPDLRPGQFGITTVDGSVYVYNADAAMTTAQWNVVATGVTGVLLTGDQTIGGVKTFEEFPRKSGSLMPLAIEELTTKHYVDTKLGAEGTLPYNPPPLAAGGQDNVLVPVLGANPLQDVCIAAHSGLDDIYPAVVLVSAYPVAPGGVVVVFLNVSGVPIDIPNGMTRVRCMDVDVP